LDDPSFAFRTISDLVKNKVQEIVFYADTIGVQMDESTGISNAQVLIILANIVVRGKPRFVFLKAIELGSATSKELSKSLEHTLFNWYKVRTDQF